MPKSKSVPSPEQLLEELRESRNSWQQSFLADDGKRRFLEAVKAVENCLAAAHPQNECCRYWIARLHLAEARLKLAKAELADEAAANAMNLLENAGESSVLQEADKMENRCSECGVRRNNHCYHRFRENGYAKCGQCGTSWNAAIEVCLKCGDVPKFPEAVPDYSVLREAPTPDELIRIGRQMANCCFNCSQSLHEVTKRDRDCMAEVYKEWDEALRKFRALADSSAPKEK